MDIRQTRDSGKSEIETETDAVDDDDDAIDARQSICLISF